MNIEQKKTVVLRIMNLALMKFSLLRCGLTHTQVFFSGLRFFNEPEISDSEPPASRDPRLKVPPGGLGLLLLLLLLLY